MIAEHRHLVEQGAQLVELRLDFIRTKVDLARLLEHRPCPTVVAIRREKDGGNFQGTESERLTLLRAAIVAGVEYVDLEDDVAGQIRRYGKTKRIVSHHDFRRTPENLDEIHARLASLDADIVKIACIANSSLDALRMLRLVKRAKVPTVAFCMGDFGVASRILAGRFGAPFTYATFHPERAMAPGQLSFQQMKQDYHYDQINADTEVYGVIGDPIGHSLSPLIHNAAFRALKLNKVYVPFRVAKEDVETFIKYVPDIGVRGLSVTIPHKEAAAQSLDEMEDAVSAIGACNTIVFDGKKRIGYNTDYAAALESLEPVIHEPTGLAGKVAMVLGAGGAAKAVAYGLKSRGCHVVITARNPEQAERLAHHLECESADWLQRHRVDIDVLVNCTPVGMHPKVNEMPYDKLQIRPGAYVFDTVYNPENTLLIKESRAKGCVAVTGVEMFVRQAARQFKLFTGQDAPMDLLRDVLKRATSAAKGP